MLCNMSRTRIRILTKDVLQEYRLCVYLLSSESSLLWENVSYLYATPLFCSHFERMLPNPNTYEIRPIISVYFPQHINNWRSKGLSVDECDSPFGVPSTSFYNAITTKLLRRSDALGTSEIQHPLPICCIINGGLRTLLIVFRTPHGHANMRHEIQLNWVTFDAKSIP